MEFELSTGATDAEVAVLSAAAGWPARAPGEVRRRYDIDPAGHIVARDNRGVLIGEGLCVVHPRESGGLGWVSGMAVHPAWRHHGIATAILRALLEHAAKRHADAVGLDATEMGAPLYARAGFTPVGASERWTRRADAPLVAPLPSRFAIYPISSCEIMDLWAYDRGRFGANRVKWLASSMARFPERAFVAFDRATGAIGGYVLSQERFIGPVVADAPEAAAWLLHAAERAGAPATVLALEANADARRVLDAAGYAPTAQRCTRMVRGGKLGGDVARQFGVATWAMG